MTSHVVPVLPLVPHWIGGRADVGSGKRVGDVYDPSTGKLTKQVAFASSADVDQAVAAAASAFSDWRHSSLSQRSKLLFAFRELANERAGELAEIVTSEHGKVLDDALGEVSRGLEVIEFACGIPQLLKGSYSENASTNLDVYSIRQPLGPVAIISPFNFPAMVPVWFFPIAIACGNTVVLKPSEKDPSASIWWGGAVGRGRAATRGLQCRPGDKVAVDRLLEHPNIKAVRSSARHRSPATSTRVAPGTESECRHSGEPRTTWSCFPTRTLTSPRTRP